MEVHMPEQPPETGALFLFVRQKGAVVEQYILPAIFLVLIVAFSLAEAYGSRRDISSDARPVEVPVKTKERVR